MSSFDRRSLILSLAALPACGFSPVYGPGTGARALEGAVRVGAPSDANSFRLVRALEIRLGQSETPRFALDVSVAIDERGSVITRTQEIDRFTLTGDASYTLSDANGALITTGKTRGTTSYSASGLPIATRAAREDAQVRLIEILADRIVTQLATAANTPPA